MIPDFTLNSLKKMYDTADQVINDLGAKPLKVPKGLAHLSAEFKGQQVDMYSYAWHSQQFKLIRMTILLMPGRLETFNFVLYPHDHFEAPVFASDFVLANGKLRIGMMDWMPIFPNEAPYVEQWVFPLAHLYQKVKSVAPQYDLKMAWSTQFTSKYACLGTGIDETKMPALVKLWQSYLSLYLDKTQDMEKVSAERANMVHNWHQTYNKAHLEVEDKRNPYMVYFGEELGKRYNKEFLFADNLG
jgi:hypothetical protein